MSDEAVERITTKIHREFRHNRVALFDEMNILQTKKHIRKLYKAVDKIIKNEFTAILNPIYESIYDEAIDMGFDGDMRELDETWIEEFFDEYNPVTKYVFSNEIERKESRLFESLISNVAERAKSYKTAERLLLNQIKQYAIDLEDAIADVVYEDVKVEQVEWVAENDSSTCPDCQALDGEIFDIDKAPDKLHYNCRCILLPVRVDIVSENVKTQKSDKT